MKKSTRALVVTASLTLAFGLSACGTGGGASSTTAPPAPAPTSSAAPAPTTSAAPAPTSAAPAGGSHLVVWTWDPKFNIYAMNEAAKVYQKAHPEFTLDVQEVSWDDIQTKMTTIAQANTLDQLPDIFLVQNNAFQKNVTNYPQLFADYGKSGIDFTQYPQSVVNYSTVDGKNWGLPFDNGAAIGVYRTDVLQQAGHTVADLTDVTWTQWEAVAKDVLAKTGKPLLSGMANSSDMIMMMLQSSGASLFDKDGKPAIVGNDALKKAIAVYQQMVKDKTYVELNSWDEYIGSFQNSNVAGVINGCWILGSIQATADQSGKWAVTNMPSVEGVPGATNYSANGGSSWAISSSSKNYALAADFLKSTFAGSTDFYDTILPSSGALANWAPAAKSNVYAQPQPFFNNDPIFTKIVEYASKVPANNTSPYYYEARDAVSAAITKILGGTDEDSALKEAQQTVEFAMQ
ncbi:MAG: carbohydrate ABC transporter substrate-binding protein [Actinomycetia bacterium]|nr:carbohydrate ABC transporter substrate-binding protein [Actinomycetes bacterium]